jgi:hypothetical protein
LRSEIRGNFVWPVNLGTRTIPRPSSNPCFAYEECISDIPKGSVGEYMDPHSAEGQRDLSKIDTYTSTVGAAPV